MLFMSSFLFSQAQEPVGVAVSDNISSILQPVKARKPLFTINASGGYSHWFMADIPDNIGPFDKFYLKKLQNGLNVGIDVNFFVANFCAIGVKYSLFRAKNEAHDLIYNFGNYTRKGDLIDRLFIHYIAPNILFRVGKPTGKVFFIFDGSLGCLFYMNHGTDYEQYTVKGAAFGVQLIPGIELKVTEGFFVNYRVGGTIGTMNRCSLTINGQTITINDAGERLHRLDLSIGFRYKY